MKIQSVNSRRSGVVWVVLNDDGTRYQLMVDGGKVFDTFKTQAKAKEVMHEAEDWVRFGVVKGWLESIGCCRMCSTLMAFAKVERERGRKYDWRAQRGECAADDETCESRAMRLKDNAPGGALQSLRREPEKKAA